LSDVDPPGDVDLFEVELEERVVGDGLDHPANPTSGNHLLDQRPRGVVGHLAGIGPDAKLVVLGAGKCVDDATRIPTEVPWVTT
jgi:hypothetical protein